MKKEKSAELASPRSPRGLPWWIYIVLAIGSYCLLKYVIPGLHPTNPAFQKFFQAAPILAPPVTILFLLLGAKGLYDADRGELGSGLVDNDDADNSDKE